MTRAASFALMIAFCVTAASAQAAGPKGKFGNHKPVAKAPSGGFNFGNVTNPIVNTPPKTVLGPINGAPAFPVKNPPRFPIYGGQLGGVNHLPVFPVNPPRFPIEGGHGPVVLNPPHHGPINGLPVFPNKPHPTHHRHHRHFSEWSWCMSMCYGDCWEIYCNSDCTDTCGDFCWDMN
jgi:hypothetical protein